MNIPYRDLPGSPVVETLSSNARGYRFDPHMPHGQKSKTQDRSTIITNSIKTLIIIHIKKIFKMTKVNLNKKRHNKDVQKKC